MEVLKEAFRERVKRKLEIDNEKLDELMAVAMGESALGILRRLKELDRKGR
jgi:hypothetical protein